MTLNQALAKEFSEMEAGILWEAMRGKNPWKMNQDEFCLLIQVYDADLIVSTPAEFNGLLTHHGIQ